MTVTIGFFNYYASAVQAGRYALASAQAHSLAEAGIDKAVYELNQNGSYSGKATPRSVMELSASRSRASTTIQNA